MHELLCKFYCDDLYKQVLQINKYRNPPAHAHRGLISVLLLCLRIGRDSASRTYMRSKWGSGYIIKVWFPECSLFRG